MSVDVSLKLSNLLRSELLSPVILLGKHLLLPLLHNCMLLLRCRHGSIHLLWNCHSLIHHRCLRHRRCIRARVAHALGRRDISHDRGDMRHAWSSLVHLRSTVSAMALLTSSWGHGMSHNTRMGMLQGRAWTLRASSPLTQLSPHRCCDMR